MDEVDQQGSAACQYRPSSLGRRASENVIDGGSKAQGSVKWPPRACPHELLHRRHLEVRREDGGGSLNMATNRITSSAPTNPPFNPRTL